MKQFRLNQKGQLTIDFLFAIVLVIGISTLLTALTFALTFTEILQYVSFAGSRSYLAADLTPDGQLKAANTKVSELLGALPFVNAKDWVEVSTKKAGNFGQDYKNRGVDITRNQFIGYRIDFKLPILGINLPLLGDSITPPNGGTQDSNFRATVSSYLMREPTASECQRFNNNVFRALLRLRGEYGAAMTNASNGPEEFSAINDNGC